MKNLFCFFLCTFVRKPQSIFMLSFVLIVSRISFENTEFLACRTVLILMSQEIANNESFEQSLNSFLLKECVSWDRLLQYMITRKQNVKRQTLKRQRNRSTSSSLSSTLREYNFVVSSMCDTARESIEFVAFSSVRIDHLKKNRVRKIVRSSKSTQRHSLETL